MITKKLTNSLYKDLRIIIQEYMHLNDGTSHRDHTLQDLWNRISYTQEGYTNLDQDKINILHDEKKQYYCLLQEIGRDKIVDFWNNAKVINKDIENKIRTYERLKRYNSKK